MMADGPKMDWNAGKAVECVSLEQAIACLHAGSFRPGIGVDLGDGAIAELNETDSPDAFLARLLAHVGLVALAETAEHSSPDLPVAVSVDSHAKALLDAIKNAR